MRAKENALVKAMNADFVEETLMKNTNELVPLSVFLKTPSPRNEEDENEEEEEEDGGIRRTTTTKEKRTKASTRRTASASSKKKTAAVTYSNGSRLRERF